MPELGEVPGSDAWAVFERGLERASGAARARMSGVRRRCPVTLITFKFGPGCPPVGLPHHE